MKIESSTGGTLGELNITSRVAGRKGTAETDALAGGLAEGAANRAEENVASSGSQLRMTMPGAHSESGLQSTLNNIVDAYAASIGSTASYADRALAGKKAGRAVQSVISGEVAESESRRLEAERVAREGDIKAAVAEAREEKRAQEEEQAADGAATTAAVADGSSSEQEGKAAAAQSAQQQAPVPSASSVGSAAAGTGTTQTESESSESASESHPSIDVTV